MHIRKIQISNIRGFREVDLDLTRPDGSLAGWTVLAGRNGAGKSTLLKAIALAVAGQDAARALSPIFAEWMRAGSREASVEVHLALSPDELALSPDEPLLLQAPRLKWARKKDAGEPILLSEVDEVLQELQKRMPLSAEEVQSLLESVLAQTLEGIPERLFLAGYGPYRRLSGQTEEAQRLMAGPEPIARAVSLFREDASLAESVIWLRDVNYQRLENKAGAVELERTVLALLDDGLLPDGVRVDKIDSDGLWVFQGEVRLPLRELSDGYRTVAALVLDLVRHLHRTFGTLQIDQTTDEEGSFLRVSHEGVVLIDEADNHLHVSWQKRIGFWLKRHFPNIQFIVTTHSPFICQAADPGGLIRLAAPGEEKTVERVTEELYKTVVHGRVDQAVLSELFGLESPYSVATDRLRNAVAQLEAKAQTGTATEADLQKLEELRDELPQSLASSVEQALRALAFNG